MSICTHGQLARSCEVCDLTAALAAVGQERDAAIRERDVAVRQLTGLRRDLAKLLAEHGGLP